MEKVCACPQVDINKVHGPCCNKVGRKHHPAGSNEGCKEREFGVRGKEGKQKYDWNRTVEQTLTSRRTPSMRSKTGSDQLGLCNT